MSFICLLVWVLIYQTECQQSSVISPSSTIPFPQFISTSVAVSTGASKATTQRGANCTAVMCKKGRCEGGVCKCTVGYNGTFCDQDINECKIPGKPVCPNVGQQCINYDGSHGCHCLPGFSGKHCSVNDNECETNNGTSKCQNGGTCVDGIGQYSCNCTSRYQGKECQYENECVTKKACNGSRCETHPNGTAICHCNSGVTGQNCDQDINECGLVNGICKDKNCTCRNTWGSYMCICGSCSRENVGTVQGLGIFSWPETKIGKSATTPCPYNLNVSATRECQYKAIKTIPEILWGPIHAKACHYHHKRSQRIFDLSEKNVNSSNAIEVTIKIKKISYPGKDLISDDVTNAASILEKIVAVKEKADELVDNFLDTVNNILDAPLDVIVESQQQQNSSQRIVNSLNNLLEILNITKGVSFQRTLKNFAVDLSLVSPRSFTGVTFSGIEKEMTDNGTISPAKAATTTISLPRLLFNEANSVNYSRYQIMILALYKETKFFRVLSSGFTNFSQRVNSYVIAGSIKGQTFLNLTNPVVLRFSTLKSADKGSTLCGFWDFSQASWSRAGCAFQGVLNGRIVCHCNHLTNFAMLMDIYPDNETSHGKILSLISYIGCAVSLVGLVFTIFTILLFKDLRSKAPNKILLNFCIALSLTLVVFLAAAERSKTSSMASCRAAAVALHYFVLVAFMWMAIEAFNMYLLFVKVMPSYFSKFLLKSCVIAWGIPAVIVSITMGVALGYYGDTKFCRLLGYPFYISFLTPVLLILVGNFIAFVVIFRSLLSRTGSKVLPNRKVSGYQQARQGAAISVLLGLTWMFGILAINDHSKVVFQYLFCIFNSLQGLLVFVFFCALPSEIRNKYRNFLTKSKKEKRKERHMEMEAGAVRKMPNTVASTSCDNTKEENDKSTFVLNTNTLSHSTKGAYSFTNSIGQIVEFASYEKK